MAEVELGFKLDISSKACVFCYGNNSDVAGQLRPPTLCWVLIRCFHLHYFIQSLALSEVDLSLFHKQGH